MQNDNIIPGAKANVVKEAVPASLVLLMLTFSDMNKEGTQFDNIKQNKSMVICDFFSRTTTWQVKKCVRNILCWGIFQICSYFSEKLYIHVHLHKN